MTPADLFHRAAAERFNWDLGVDNVLLGVCDGDLEVFLQAVEMLNAMVPGHDAHAWSLAPGRTKADVLRLLDAAARADPDDVRFRSTT